MLFIGLFSRSVATEAPENEHHNDTEEKQGFDAGETIFHHVKDAHELHLFNFPVYLPIIIYDEGLKVFSSSHFYHNELHTSTGEHYYEHEGYILFHEKIYRAEEGLALDEHGHPQNMRVLLDLSITKNVAGMILSTLLLFWIFMSVAKRYKKTEGAAPKGMQNLLEPLILFVRDEVAEPSIGHNYKRYMPFLLTIFFFIWMSNMLGLLPFLGGMNITGNIAVTAMLALFTFIITTVSGNKGYWMHIIAPPGVPYALYILLVPIEIIGVFLKPIVLMLRLFANITAGHIIILAFTCLIFIFQDLYGTGVGWASSIGTLIFGIFMNILELLVAFLQAYVFTLLSALYFGMATEEAH